MGNEMGLAYCKKSDGSICKKYDSDLEVGKTCPDCSGIIKGVTWNAISFSELLDETCVYFNIDTSSFRETAKKAYDAARSIAGWPPHVKMLAIIYAAMMIDGQPGTIYNKFLYLVRVPRRDMFKIYRRIKIAMGVEGGSSLRTCVDGVCDKLDVGSELRAKIFDFVTRLENGGQITHFSGRPSTLAAGIVYYVVSKECHPADPRFSQKKIATACCISDVTVRNTLREIERMMVSMGG